MLATPTVGLLPSARLLLPRAIRETSAGAWDGPPCDATGGRRWPGRKRVALTAHWARQNIRWK
jgi:hypothetical protein